LLEVNLNIFRKLLAVSISSVLIGCTVTAGNAVTSPPTNARYVYDTSSREALSVVYDTLQQFKLKNISPLGGRALGYSAEMDSLPTSIQIVPCVGTDNAGHKIVAYAIEYRLNGTVISAQPSHTALEKINQLSAIRSAIEQRLENHKVVMHEFRYIDL
jgi:hypothetical protein